MIKVSSPTNRPIPKGVGFFLSNNLRWCQGTLCGNCHTRSLKKVDKNLEGSNSPSVIQIIVWQSLEFNSPKCSSLKFIVWQLKKKMRKNLENLRFKIYCVAPPVIHCQSKSFRHGCPTTLKKIFMYCWWI